MPNSKPVSNELKTWAQSEVRKARAEYHLRDQTMIGLRRQRFMRLKPNPPEAYQRIMGEGVRVPMSYRLIQTVVGAVAGSDRVKFHTVTPDPELQNRGNKWFNLQISAQERMTQPALYWRWWDSMVSDGMAVLKTQRNPWTEYPKRTDETAAEYNSRVRDFFSSGPPVPWKTRVVDPATFYPGRPEWGHRYIIEHGLRSAADTFRTLGVQMSPTGTLIPIAKDEPVSWPMTGLYTKPLVEVSEIWSPDEMLVIVGVGGEQVFRFENELGRIPYVWAFANAVAFADPTLMGTGAAFPLMYIEPWVNQALSQMVGYSTMQAVPTPFTVQENVPGTVLSDTQITDFKTGKLHQFGPGIKPGFFELPPARESIDLLNVMVQLAERFTLSPVPQFAGTRTPGVVIASVAERVMSILRPMVDQAQVAWSEQMKLYVHLIKDVVKAPVYISGLTFEEHLGKRGQASEVAVAPKDIRKITDVLSEIKFQTIQDKIAWNSHAVVMNKQGVWSRQRAQLESGVEDTEGEDRRIAVERLVDSPQIQLYLLQRGLEGQPPLEALQELIQSAGGGVPSVGESEATTRLTPGRNAGEPRQPGGMGNMGAEAGRVGSG